MLYYLGGTPAADEYENLMNHGFRRSGELAYAAACEGCSACVSIRVPVAQFERGRTQRRVWRRNQDLELRFGRPILDDERFELYERYQRSQHDGEMLCGRDGYDRFLVRGLDCTEEMSYWLRGKLVAVGVVDVCPTSISSVYFYFDPDHGRRGLGAFSAICEIEECRRRGLTWWYAGYFVAGCAKMEYKAQYRPHEFLHADGTWRSEHP